MSKALPPCRDCGMWADTVWRRMPLCSICWFDRRFARKAKANV